MSGAEIMGVLASTTQLAAYTIAITNTAREIYREVKGAPERIQQHTRQLSLLIQVAHLIESRESLQTEVISDQVRSTLQQAENLHELLQKLKEKISKSSVKRVWTALIGDKGKEIEATFERLEREKSALLLCISLVQSDVLGEIQVKFDQVIAQQELTLQSEERPSHAVQDSKVSCSLLFD